MSSGRRVPYPPLELASRVRCLEGEKHPYGAYERHGAEAKAAILDLLPEDWSFEGKRVLDFGCGAGRTLRHFLAEAESGDFWGAELDAASVDWLLANLSPPLQVRRSSVAPPLGLEPGSLDLVWALSVFTHLTNESIPWLLELHRLLKPSGLLLATYTGRVHSDQIGEPWDEDKVGMNVLRHHRDWDDGGPSVLMSDWWVRAHWGRAFEILRVEPVHGQSWALMRKRDVELTQEDIEQPEDDPREYEALRHNLRQVQRELGFVSELAKRQAEALRRSPIWRISTRIRLHRWRRSAR